MKTKELKKLTALFVSLAMLLALIPAALAADEWAVVTKGVTYDEASDEVTAALLTVKTPGKYTTYAAVYENNALVDVAADTSTLAKGDVTVTFDEALSFDSETQTLKVFVWNNSQIAVAKDYTYGDIVEDETGTTEGYLATFVIDGGHATVNVSNTQSFDEGAYITENASEAYARDGSTGEISTSGGQVNFQVILDDGYEVDSVTATADTYKNIKDQGNNIYRVTQITGNTTITITTKEKSAEEQPTSGGGTIHLNGTSIDISEVTAGAELDETGTTATITLPGSYTVDGTLNDGQIAVNYTAVNAADTVVLTLDGISLTSLTGYAVNGISGDFTLASKEDTTSTITSNADDAVYSKANIEVKGSGTLNVVSTAGNGIRSKENVEIGMGTLNVTASTNGIKGDEKVKLTKKCGTVTITSGGDGITSDNAPTIKKPSKTGEVEINGGNITITTSTYTNKSGETKNGDGIQADTLLTIAGGEITIDAAGEAIKANFSHLDLAAEADYETYKDTLAAGDGCITISGGTITAKAGEDGVKATKDVTVSGGTVTINSAGDDGIQAGDVVINETTPSSSQRIDGTVTVSDGAIDIKNAAGDGIATTLTYEQTGGSVTAVAAKDGVQAGKAYTYYDIHGSGDDETILYETNGVVNVTGGTLNITTAGGATRPITDNDGNTTLNDINYSCKGIKARKLIDISGGTLNINALDDALHSNHTMRISGGDITVQSCDDGVHGEYYLYISGDAKIDVQKSYEGIEGSKIYISGGETYVVSTDDGANAAGDEPTDSAITLSGVYNLSSVSSEDFTLMAGPGGWNQPGGGMNDNSASYGYLEVSGGLLYIEAEGDGFDSNGSGLISGGTVLVNGPTSGGNGVFDIGDNSGDTLTITGGTVIGAGTSDMAVTPTATTGSQAYVVTTLTSNQTAGKGIQVLNGSNEIITYVPSKAYKWIFVSTPSILSGTSYSVKYGGTVSGGAWGANYNETYGIKTGATFSSGSTATVTAVTSGGSSSSGGGNQPPSRP